MKTKHTPTPWMVEVSTNSTSIESRFFTVCTDVTNEDAERIVSCVTACDGIENPAVIPDLVHALRFTLDTLRDPEADEVSALKLEHSISELLRRLDGR